MRLGLLGGTFDPVHLGHLDVAHAARRALALDSVWLIPSHVPPHRARPHASAAHRFAMVALATINEDRLVVSDLEMEPAEPSYTSATLDRLALRGLDLMSVFFIAGADAFRDITAWKTYPQLVDRCHFVAVSRPGAPASDLRQILPALESRMVDIPCDLPSRPSIFLVDAPTTAVSSTDVRSRLARGEPLHDWLPAHVSAYIKRQHLYAPEAHRESGSQGVA